MSAWKDKYNGHSQQSAHPWFLKIYSFFSYSLSPYIIKTREARGYAAWMHRLVTFLLMIRFSQWKTWFTFHNIHKAVKPHAGWVEVGICFVSCVYCLKRMAFFPPSRFSLILLFAMWYICGKICISVWFYIVESK